MIVEFLSGNCDSKVKETQKAEKVGTVVLRKDCIETPFGKVVLPLEKVLDIMCDLGYEEVTVFGDFSFERVETLMGGITKVTEEKEIIEWETPRSVIEKLKKLERSKVCGAIAMFVGFVRGINKGRKVLWLEYERNNELYKKKLEELKERIAEHSGIEGVEVFHRAGKVGVGEDIVYVAVMGRSRKDVWNAIVEAVEGVKKDLPIWKKEVFENGEEWI